MTRLFHAGLTLLTALGLVFASPAVAQTPAQKPQQAGAPSAAQGMRGQMGPGMGGGARPMMGMMLTNTEGGLAFLKSELGITGEQKGVWDAYVAQVKLLIGQSRENMRTMQTMHDPATKPLTWIEWLIHSETRMNSHVQAVKNIRPAATALYDALSPEQKKKADALMPGVMGTHMGMPMGDMPM